MLDASLTLSWAFDDEATPFTVQVLKTLEAGQAVAPALWPFEVANVLAMAERRGRINAAQQAQFLERLRLLPVAGFPGTSGMASRTCSPARRVSPVSPMLKSNNSPLKRDHSISVRFTTAAIGVRHKAGAEAADPDSRPAHHKRTASFLPSRGRIKIGT